MVLIFVILIILASVALGFIVLVQNPKGGGLAGSFAGLSNQFMGVKQTTDVLEKGTWIFGGIIAALCLASTFFIPSGEGVETSTKSNAVEAPVPANRQATPPAGNTSPLQQPPANQQPATPNP